MCLLLGPIHPPVRRCHYPLPAELKAYSRIFDLKVESTRAARRNLLDRIALSSDPRARRAVGWRRDVGGSIRTDSGGTITSRSEGRRPNRKTQSIPSNETLTAASSPWRST